MAEYRQYEDPRALEKELKEKKELLEKAQNEGADEDTLVELHDQVEDLEQRVNIAWQDEEFDMEHSDEP